MIKKALKTAARLFGYEIKKPSTLINNEGIPKDITDPDFLKYFNICKKHSLCSIEPMYALYRSVEYIIKNKIQGDFVECGVFKGGSSMMMAYTLMHFKDTSRKIYMYDTFEGMSEPTTIDVDIFEDAASKLLDKKSPSREAILCKVSLNDVKQNLQSTGYDMNNIIFTKGEVEKTIPGTIPNAISLLRLDTDWYESTYHELVHLYPILTKNGVLIIDDYGHWKGAREATDKYFAANGITGLLNRIDYTVRIMIKN